jgi:hypothetical protein
MEKKRRTGGGTKRKPLTKRRTSSTPSRISRADQSALQQLDRLLELRRRQEQLAAKVPPEVSTERIDYPDGTVLFRFSHAALGFFGQLKIIPVPAYMVPVGGCLVNVELFPDDPEEDQHWDEKYQLLSLMVMVCTSALPEEKMLRSPLTPGPSAREQRRLYLRFLACRHTDELRAFVGQLSEEQYPLLLAGIEQARTTASNQDLAGIIQRQKDVSRLWAERRGGKDEPM